MNSTLSITRAKLLVERIRSHIDEARKLVLELYEQEGWKVLGYDSWAQCVSVEFAQSRRHLYRLLDAAHVERNIAQLVENQQNVCPTGHNSIPERVLRPLARLEPEEQREAWAIVTQLTSTPTAEQVSQVVDTMKRAIEQARIDVATVTSVEVLPEEEKEEAPEFDQRWIEFFAAVARLIHIEWSAVAIAKQQFAITDELSVISNKVLDCDKARCRINEVISELEKRSSHVLS
jgi:DNA-directed RNA polymerase subunit F